VVTAAAAVLLAGCTSDPGASPAVGPWPPQWLQQTIGALTSLWQPAGPYGGYFLQPELPRSPALAADSVLALDEAGFPVPSVLTQLQWSFDARTGLYHDPSTASYDDETTYAVLSAAVASGERLPGSLVRAVSAALQAHETSPLVFDFSAPGLPPEPVQTSALYAARIASLLFPTPGRMLPRWDEDLRSSFRCAVGASADDLLSSAAIELQTATLLGRRCVLPATEIGLLGGLGAQALRKVVEHPDPPSIGAVGLDLAPLAAAVPSLAVRWRGGLARLETEAETALRTTSIDADFAMPIVALLRATGKVPRLGTTEVSWLRTTWRWEGSFPDPGNGMQDPFSTVLGEQSFLVAARLDGRDAVVGRVDDGALLEAGARPALVLVLDAGTGTPPTPALVSRLSATSLIRYAPAVAAFAGMIVTGRLRCGRVRPLLAALAADEVSAASREGAGTIPLQYGYSGGLTADAVDTCDPRSRGGRAERLRTFVRAGLRAWARAGASELATDPLGAWWDAEAECTLGVRPRWSPGALASMRERAFLPGGGARGASGRFSLEDTYAILRVGEIAMSGCAGGWWTAA
jgi:hypothetical protein